MMIRSRCFPLRQVFVVLLIVAGPARGDLAGKAARKVAERLGRGLRGTASRRAARHVDTARAIGRHLSAGTPLAALGRSSYRAMPALAPRNARRLAMLAEDGALARSGRWGELVAVIERHGDRAMDFIWRHKGALAVSTILATFLAEPEVFLGGGRELMSGAAEELTRPPVEAADSVAMRLLRAARGAALASLALPLALTGLWLSFRLVRHLRRQWFR